MRALKFLFTIAFLAVGIYLAVAVPIGEPPGALTLWQHVRAIARTGESQRFRDDVQGASKRLIKNARKTAGQEHGW